LKSLGVHKIFTGVDCSKTLGTQLVVDKITQKTYLDVDEEGTEAAAVTAVHLRLACAKVPVIEKVICNHPFWFVIEKEPGEVLFVASFIE